MTEDAGLEAKKRDKNSKLMGIIGLILLIFVVLLGYWLLAGQRSGENDVVSPTPTGSASEEDVNEPTGAEEDAAEVSLTPTAAPTETLDPTTEPTDSPSPTSVGPGGFQSNPTNTLTPGQLPLSN